MTDEKPGTYERWKYEQDRAVAERSHDMETDFLNRTNEAAVNTGHQALRALIIINGGAAIAMLAFIGHLVSADKVAFLAKLSQLTHPLTWFAWGVALATFGIGLAYCANYTMATASFRRSRHYDHPFIRATPSSKRWLRAAYTLQVLAVLVAAVSLVFFVLGMLEIRDVIAVLRPPA